MLWQYILTIASAVMFFGFVYLCIRKFGLLTCYSAYGPSWAKTPPWGYKLNPWTIITVFTAALLIPVTIELSDGTNWQWAGFLCPALLLFVGLTPDYGKSKLANYVHCVCAGLAAILSVVYILCVFPHLWWLLVIYVAIATVGTIICGKDYWCFWFEMAAYAGIYTTVLLMI